MNTKPWLATYRENGIAETVNADAYPSVVHMLDEAMQRYAERTAFHSFGQRLTFAEVDRLSGAFAAWLQQRLVRELLLPLLQHRPRLSLHLLPLRFSKCTCRTSVRRARPRSSKCWSRSATPSKPTSR